VVGGQDLDVWYRSAEALDGWLDGAAPGERFEYAYARILGQHPVCERVRALVAEGEVVPIQERNAAGCHYLVERTAGIAPAPGRARQRRVYELSPEDGRLLAAVLRAVRAGRDCPSNTGFAQAAGLRHRDDAKNGLERLRRGGFVLIEQRGGRGGASERRIIHVGTGKATGWAAPPPPPAAKKKGKRK